MKIKTLSIIISSLLLSSVKSSLVCWLDEQTSDKSCCESTSIKPDYIDSDGHLWANENGVPCAIKEPECFTELLGYPCCPNNKVHYIDDDGEWGYMNNNWCGIKFKRRWNDRSILNSTYSEWLDFQEMFDKQVYPGAENPYYQNLVQDYDFRERLSMTPGADETKLNFGWYSRTQTIPKVRVLDITAMVSGLEFTNAIEFASNLDINNFNMEEADVFTGEATYHKTMDDVKLYSNKVEVSNLNGESIYIYQYQLNDEWIVENPPRVYKSHSDLNDFTVILIGDPQVGGTRKRIAYVPENGGWSMLSGEKAVRNDAFNLYETLNHAYGSNPKASFIISAGDQIHTSSEKDKQQEIEYSGFLSAPVLRHLPIAPISGNHDHEYGSTNFRHHFNNPNQFKDEIAPVNSGPGYYFSHGKVLFIMLNSNNLVIKDHKNLIDTAVNAHPEALWRIVVLHFDLYGPGFHLNEDPTKILRTGLTPVFFEYKIDVVLQGHNHIHARTHLLSQTLQCPDVDSFDSLDATSLPNAEDFKCYNVTKPMIIENSENSSNAVVNASDINVDEIAQEEAMVHSTSNIITDVQDVNGMDVVQSDYQTVFTNPNGIVFFEASTSTGSIYHTPEQAVLNFVARRGQPLNPLYSVINFSINHRIGKSVLYFNTYKASNDEKYDNGYKIIKDIEIIEEPTMTTTTPPEPTPTEDPVTTCWSIDYGYNCCGEGIEMIIEDELGKW